MIGRAANPPMPVVPGLLMALATCDSSDLLGPGAPQGVEGVALLGPLCPVQTEENPCPDRPYEAWVQVRSTAGRLVTRFRTGKDGRFRVGLSPGHYVLVPESGDPFPVAGEQAVEVTLGLYTEVVISFDTGIR